MKKNSVKFIASIAAVGLLSTGVVFATETENINAPATSVEDTVTAPVINGATVSGVEIVEVNGIKMIPLRTVAEGLGFQVNWIEESQSIELIKGAQFITMSINKDEYAFSRRAPQSLGAAPILYQDTTTYVPISFVTDILNGYLVENEDKTYNVVNPSIVTVTQVEDNKTLIVSDSYHGEVVVAVNDSTKFIGGAFEDIKKDSVLAIEYSPEMTASIPPMTNAVLIRFENLEEVEEAANFAFEGEITAIEENLVTIGKAEEEGAIRVVVDENTQISKGKDKRIYKIDDLSVGMKISGTHAEQMTMSIPPQSLALTINIVD